MRLETNYKKKLKKKKKNTTNIWRLNNMLLRTDGSLRKSKRKF